MNVESYIQMLPEVSKLPGCASWAEHPIVRDILWVFCPCTFLAQLEFKCWEVETN